LVVCGQLGDGAFADAVKSSDGGMVGVGEGVEILLRCRDRRVAHALLHYLYVGAAGEQPGGVGVA
jgi:hypothetical protein